MSFGLCPNWEDETGEIEEITVDLKRKVKANHNPKLYTTEMASRRDLFKQS